MKRFDPLTDSDSVEPILSQISFLGGITETQRENIYSYFEGARYAKGEFIARHGEEPSHIYIIKSGVISLQIDDGGEIINKRTFAVGDCFGEAAMLSLINNTASFVAAEDCELVAISRKSMNRLRREDPVVFSQLILNLARDLARKLQFTDEMLLHPDAEKLQDKD